MKLAAGVGLVVLVGIIIGVWAYREVTNPCIEWDETGAMRCTELWEGHTRCEPELRCVQRRFDP